MCFVLITVKKDKEYPVNYLCSTLGINFLLLKISGKVVMCLIIHMDFIFNAFLANCLIPASLHSFSSKRNAVSGITSLVIFQ